MFNMNNNMVGNMNLNMNMNMNINPMGMNNQLMLNLPMDNSALRIKAIIEPYEKKIMELENIIKQKDFEIVLLKEKLNDITNNQMMMNFQNNMNIMNPMIINNNNGNFMNNYNFNLVNNNLNMNPHLVNHHNNKPLEGLIINFNYNEKNYTESCKENEKSEDVFKRFCDKIGINHTAYKFIFNKYILSKQCRIIENGLVNDSKILVIEKDKYICDDYTFCNNMDKKCECEGLKYNVVFIDSRGDKKIIYLGKDHSLRALIERYLRMSHAREFDFSINGLVLCSLNLKWEIDGNIKINDIFKRNINQNVNISEHL